MEAKGNEVIKAAGGLVWREELGVKKIAIVHRTRYGGEWTLPKGKLEKDEAWAHAARREVSEEIGCNQNQLVVESSAGSMRYTVQGRPKIVRFWNMRLEGDPEFGKTDVEVNQVKWLSVDEALELLSHPKEKALLRKNCCMEDSLHDI